MAITSDEQLVLYNGALRMVGERKLGSITESREPRRVLDDIWAEDAVKACLEAGAWGFATRTALMEYDAGLEPDFGYQYGFEKPSDWVRTNALSLDEYFNQPLTGFTDEAGVIYTDSPEVYLSWVSDDNLYGNNYSLWTPSFKNYVMSYLAAKIVPTIANAATTVAKLEESMEKLLSNAQGKNAITRPTKRMPQGSWVSSRTGGGRDVRRSDR